MASRWSTSQTRPIRRWSAWWQPPGNAEGVTVSGNLAYVTGEPFVLQVVDIGNPLAPQTLGVLAPSAGWWGDYAGHDIAISGNYAYVVHRYGKGLVVVDISNPASPQFVSEVATPGLAIAIHGTHAYVTGISPNLQVLDISNPASPNPVGWFNTGGAAGDVAIAGEHAIVTGFGLRVAPLQCESSVAVYLVDLEAQRDGSHGVVRWSINHTGVDGNFRVWRETGGSTRTLLGDAVLIGPGSYEYVDQAPPSGEAEYWLEQATVGGSTSWFGPARLSAAALPAFVSLQQNRPNPFNPRTTLRYSLPQAGRVTLAVHDLRGGRITTLVDAEVPAGDWTAEWDGLDSQGIAVPSGVYLARLETPSSVQTVKMTLAR